MTVDTFLGHNIFGVYNFPFWPITKNEPPVCHSDGLLFLCGALDGNLLFPSHAASGCCILWDAAACVPDVVFAFAEPSCWRTGVVLLGAGLFLVFAAHSPAHSGHPPTASPRFHGYVFRQVAVSSRCPGQSPVLPFACCVGSLCSDRRFGLCSYWCLPEPSSWHTGVVLVGTTLWLMVASGVCSLVVDAGGTCTSVVSWVVYAPQWLCHCP